MMVCERFNEKFWSEFPENIQWRMEQLFRKFAKYLKISKNLLTGISGLFEFPHGTLG